MDIFLINCCKIVAMFVWKRPKINEKEAGDDPFFLKKWFNPDQVHTSRGWGLPTHELPPIIQATPENIGLSIQRLLIIL